MSSVRSFRPLRCDRLLYNRLYCLAMSLKDGHGHAPIGTELEGWLLFRPYCRSLLANLFDRAFKVNILLSGKVADYQLEQKKTQTAPRFIKVVSVKEGMKL